MNRGCDVSQEDRGGEKKRGNLGLSQMGQTKELCSAEETVTKIPKVTGG
jgi:hypothetical protein